MKARSHIRTVLREATEPVHQRLHGHEGLGAVASGTIGRADYRKLLARLYGFHAPFDSRVLEAGTHFGLPLDLASRNRALHIVADLQNLGADLAAISHIVQCNDLFMPSTPAEFMGALYVVEGSTLGGMQLARALRPLFGADGTEGRRFFSGYAERHSAMWQEFLQALDALASDPHTENEIVQGALRTFDDFEHWMAGWQEPSVLDGAPHRDEIAMEIVR